MNQPGPGRVGVWNRAVVTDRSEFLRRYEERFRTVVECEPETELYVVGLPMGSDLPEEEANVVYFFEVFTDLEARNFHIENPDAMAAKELWWDDLLVSRSPILLDMVWAKGMTSIGEAAWLNNYGPEQLSTVEAGIQ